MISESNGFMVHEGLRSKLKRCPTIKKKEKKSFDKETEKIQVRKFESLWILRFKKYKPRQKRRNLRPLKLKEHKSMMKKKGKSEFV